MHSLKRSLILSIVVVVSHVAFLHAQNYSIILGRPTATSITPSIVIDGVYTIAIEYGTTQGSYLSATEPLRTESGVPVRPVLTGLNASTRYYYRLRITREGQSSPVYSPEYTFHTQRSLGESFTFLIEADEHLYDKKGVRSLYSICLDNQAQDSADFMMSLGDTFGDDHTPDVTTSKDMDDLHRDYLQYLGKVCHSMPFFFCLGNHEGESGYYLNQNPPNNIAVWGTLWRKYYYPNPVPDDFYSGNVVQEPHGIQYPENYYAFTWGDALFVVLDVYRHCDVNVKPQNWDWTLGETQYRWMKQVLQTSTSKYKFVFAHHTRGQGRGAVATATGAEWGGYSAGKNKYEFDTYRPGWGDPIHQLMVKTGVNIFFQGHDHLYAREELDGLVYQTVPMPSDATYSIGVTDNGDAYSGLILDGSGHLRVNVAGDRVTVDYVRAWLPKDTVDGSHVNGEVAHSYSVTQRITGVDAPVAPQVLKIVPNPAQEKVSILLADDAPVPHVKIYNVLGTLVFEGTTSEVDIEGFSHGTYVVYISTPTQSYCQHLQIGQ